MKKIVAFLIHFLLASPLMAEIIPYLQTATDTSVIINWESSVNETARLLYGINGYLTEEMAPEAETIGNGHVWYTVRLNGLQPHTFYDYQIKTDSDESAVCRFKTFPEVGSAEGHIRFIVRSDNQTYFETGTEIVTAMVDKLTDRYGDDFYESIDLFFNVGDIVGTGSALDQYQREYFKPIAPLSPYIPVMVSIGNHENESPYYYQYMKYDDFAGPEGETYYSFRLGRLLIISLNSNSEWRNDTQIEWLEQVLDQAESDDTVDWIFTFCHHPPLSSVWTPGNTAYVSDRIAPLLADNAKAFFLINGHTHAYERGALVEDALRIMVVGGGGGSLDRWSRNLWYNYDEHHRTFDHYHWVLFDVNIETGLCTVETFSMGHPDKPLYNVKIDSFTHERIPPPPPDKPVTLTVSDSISLPCSIRADAYKGNSPFLSSHIQIAADPDDFSKPLVEIKRDFEDYFLDTGAPDWQPVNQNAGMDPEMYTLSSEDIQFGGVYYWRIRYRDQQLQWSVWSDTARLNIIETGFSLPETHNNALAFNSRDGGYLEITDQLNDALLPVRAMTVETWVKLESHHSWGGYIGAFQDNGGYEKGWVLGNYNRRFSFALSTTGADDGDGDLTYMESPGEFEYGRWYHVAATYDGVTMRLYINGILAQTNNEQSGNIVYDTNSYFSIGAYLDENEKFILDGELDAVRLWKTALSESAIQNWMHKEINDTHSEYEDLISSWSFNETAMTAAPDLTENNTAYFIDISPLQIISSSAPVGRDGILLKTGTSASVGQDGTHLLAEITTLTSNTNYLGLYQIGDKDSALIYGEQFAYGDYVRQPVHWGVFEFGNMAADLYFYYNDFTAQPVADSLRLFKRSEVIKAWQDVSEIAVHNKSDCFFKLEGQDEFGEYAVGFHREAVTAIGEEQIRPVEALLIHNYPNPFNPETNITFKLPATHEVDLAVFDITGKRIRHLVTNEIYKAGQHTVVWKGTDNNGNPVASGIYFCRLKTGKGTVLTKLTLIR